MAMVPLSSLLLIILSVGIQGSQQSDLLAALYKKAVRNDRPLVLVLDNQDRDEASSDSSSSSLEGRSDLLREALDLLEGPSGDDEDQNQESASGLQSQNNNNKRNQQNSNNLHQRQSRQTLKNNKRTNKNQQEIFKEVTKKHLLELLKDLKSSLGLKGGESFKGPHSKPTKKAQRNRNQSNRSQSDLEKLLALYLKKKQNSQNNNQQRNSYSKGQNDLHNLLNDYNKGQSRNKPALRTSILSNLYSLRNRLSCDALDECKMDCRSRRYSFPKKLTVCYNDCKKEFKCEAEKKGCDDCGSADTCGEDSGCGEETGSTKGYIEGPEEVKCKRC